MPIKKSELYGSIWRSCDELRGGMDASQYKDYVLALLFVDQHMPQWRAHRQELNSAPLAHETWSY